MSRWNACKAYPKNIFCEGVWQYYDNNNWFYVSKKIGYAPDVAFPSNGVTVYLIDMQSARGTWESNPYVAAYSFELAGLRYGKKSQNK